MDQDNFVKKADDQGVALSSVAMPSQAQLAYRQYQEKKTVRDSEQMTKLMEKYGGEEHRAQAQPGKKSSTYQEYDAKGRI